MKGIIVINIDQQHSLPKALSLIKEFKKRAIEVELITNNGLLYEIKNNTIVSHLSECDFIIYLDKDKYTAMALEERGYLVIPNQGFISLCDDKIVSILKVASLGISVIDSMSLPLVFHDLKPENYDTLERAIKRYHGFPLVLKRAFGSRGEGIYKVNNKEELYARYESMYKDPLMIQPYIESHNSSTRVLVINHQIVGAIKRESQNDFRSNCGENTSSKYNINSRLEDIVNTLIKNLNINYAGIDFLVNEKGDYIFLEINSNAFYEEFEKATGIEVSKLYVDMVLEMVKKQKVDQN